MGVAFMPQSAWAAHGWNSIVDVAWFNSLLKSQMKIMRAEQCNECTLFDMHGWDVWIANHRLFHAPKKREENDPLQSKRVLQLIPMLIRAKWRRVSAPNERGYTKIRQSKRVGALNPLQETSHASQFSIHPESEREQEHPLLHLIAPAFAYCIVFASLPLYIFAHEGWLFVCLFASVKYCWQAILWCVVGSWKSCSTWTNSAFCKMRLRLMAPKY